MDEKNCRMDTTRIHSSPRKTTNTLDGPVRKKNYSAVLAAANVLIMKLAPVAISNEITTTDDNREMKRRVENSFFTLSRVTKRENENECPKFSTVDTRD
ncbi:hypothetical protein KIN20_000122 [Parelaphostrongylus tenuis]|uniref:Uncharacterized protein n=1 Tax=Parelaphostrongylus tenuis TaxID=148309 RepID=A0AAD5LVN3_PARTN|nr:hypothetical protein KIN20_000122 [Parelaphostrongylus tenuis]